MSKLKAIIVDDEPPARKRLRALLKDHEDIQTVAECANGMEAVSAIKRYRPDIVFLDVQMPVMDGFAVIEEVGVKKMPAVIFVTAYDHHALRAFEVSALDYLLKPFDEARFADALRRARQQVTRREGGSTELAERLLKAIDKLSSAAGYRTRLAVKSSERIYFVPIEEIDWIGAAGKCVLLHVGAREHLCRTSIGQVEAELDPARFIRVHRSTIVQLDRIKELQPLFHGEFAIILHDGTKLTLSRGFRKNLRAMLNVPD